VKKAVEFFLLKSLCLLRNSNKPHI